MPQRPLQPQPYLRPLSELDRKMMGKYEVLCRLAAGGMAELFLANQRGLAGFRKIVVLKSILPDIRGEEELVRMFLAEAQITAQFNHPHIAQVFDLGVDADVLFIAMEFVQGCTLVELARACDRESAAIPIGLTLRAGHDVALALHYAHAFVDARGRKQQVVHRDVAEKNIMVTHEGVVKLLDFGIAKSASGRSRSTAIGQVKGSSGYMSPEQIRGDPIDGRSDLFSLGVVLHECLTGYRLFRGNSPEESMTKTLEDVISPPSITNPEVPAAVDEVVMKALSRDREQRYSTALELARDLERAAGASLWPAEQCGALVAHHFADRQEQVRTLLDGLQDQTGEVGISQLLAHMQALRNAADPPRPPRPPPPPPPVPKLVIGDPEKAVSVDRVTGVIPAPQTVSIDAPEDKEDEQTVQISAFSSLDPPAPVPAKTVSLGPSALGSTAEPSTEVQAVHPDTARTNPELPLKKVVTEVLESLDISAVPPLAPPPVLEAPTDAPRPAALSPEPVTLSEPPAREGVATDPAREGVATDPARPVPASAPAPPAPSPERRPGARRVLRRPKPRVWPYAVAGLGLLLTGVMLSLLVQRKGPFARPPAVLVPAPQPTQASVPVLELAPEPEPEPELAPEPEPEPEPGATGVPEDELEDEGEAEASAPHRPPRKKKRRR